LRYDRFTNMAEQPTITDYTLLLELRTSLRRFLRWSDERAGELGLTPGQHQLLLAIKGHGDTKGPTISDVAGYLLLRHHSAVGLVDRAENAGLVLRGQDPDNYRLVRLRLTEYGETQLEALADLHLDELRQLAPTIKSLWGALETKKPPTRA
jgi:DNA-binding MarR family transcriptional regulator